MTWVFKYSEVNVPGRRLVLLALADRADPDGTKIFPSIETVARDTRMSERGVRYALRALEADGAIQRVGVNVQHHGTTEYVVLMTTAARGATVAPLQMETPEGGKSLQDGGAQVAPKPSLLQPPKQQPSNTAARAREEWPGNLTDTATAQEVLDILIEVAHEHGSPPPTRKALGLVLLAYPDRAHTAEAYSLASWFLDKPVKDTAATYRNWLKRAAPAAQGQPTKLRAVTSTGKPHPSANEKESSARWQGWAEWAAENMPDIPAPKVIGAAQMLEYGGHAVTPENVRRRLGVAS